MKKPAWYKKVRFWKFAAFVLAPFAIVGEGAIIGLDLHPAMHFLVIVAVGVVGYDKFYVKDENNDGIVD